MVVPFGVGGTRSTAPHQATTDGERAHSPSVELAGLRARSLGVRIGLPETELVAFDVLTGREPAHSGHRQRVAALAAERAHAGRLGVDVVDVEVDARPALLAVGTVDRTARRLGEPGHVVLGRAPGVLLELPAEERAPELACPGGVAGRDLEVNHLACHLSPFLAS